MVLSCVCFCIVFMYFNVVVRDIAGRFAFHDSDKDFCSSWKVVFGAGANVHRNVMSCLVRGSRRPHVSVSRFYLCRDITELLELQTL